MRSFLLGGAAACALCWVALAGCGSRTGFLDGDGVTLPDDDATGNAGSGGAAGASGLGAGGGSMAGGAGVAGAAGSSVQPPDELPPAPPDVAQGCADGGRFEGDIVVFDSDDLAQLEGCTEVRGDLQIRARVADLRPLRALREVTRTLSIVRGPFSLEGLENLREVQDLQLESVQASSLLPLSGLQRVGGLSISGSVPQANLAGLGSILNLRELSLTNTALPSLAGLAVPPRMRSIVISSSTVLDLSALDVVSQIDQELVLSDVIGLSTLDAFSSLASVRVLNVVRNQTLVHIDAIANLSQVDQITITDNPSLEHLPDFAQLRSTGYVHIERNPVLRNVPPFSQAERMVQLVIASNPALERVELPSLGSVGNASELGQLRIVDNQALSEIRAPALQSAQNLLFAANPALTTVDLPVLQTVPQRLTVVLNPALPSASLGPLLTATTSLRKVGANLGDTPLASCPWTNDDHCDETSNVCVAGSDLVDCSNAFPPY